MKKWQPESFNAISTLLALSLLLAAPVNADTMIMLAGVITVDVDALTATGNQSATLEEVDPIHVYEDWFLQGRLEHPAGFGVSCNDSGYGGITTQLSCTTHRQYIDCAEAFGAQRGHADSQIIISANNPSNRSAHKQLRAKMLRCNQCFADETNTVLLPLGVSPYIPFKTNSLAHQLVRTKQFGGERFVMDEWAVKSSGNWATAPKNSSDRFRDIVATQLNQPGSFLVIQEPIHELNARWIPLPEIQIVDKSLAADRRGSGEIVAIRAEIFQDQHVEDVQVLYGSRPIDEVWIRDLVRERLSLKFSSHTEHPTVAFLVLHIGEQLEVVESRSVLPKCCDCLGPACGTGVDKSGTS